MASLQQQLANIAQKYIGNGNAKLANGKSMRQVLKEEGQKLYNILQEEIDNYYSSYTPVQYVRSYRFKQSLRVSTVEFNGGELSIRVYFDRGLAVHPSYVNNGEDGFVPLLYSYGLSLKDPSKAPYRFSQYSPKYHGTDIIGRGVRRYNETNPYNIKIHVHSEWDGAVIEDSIYN